jgi:parallel beta-helix repeat protein
LFLFASSIQPARAQSGTIYINPNGSISSPVPANITTSDNVTYTLTGNNYLPVVVNRSNVIIDGRGHMLEASGETGFSLTGVSNVTIKNITITNSEDGIYLYHSSGDVLSGNDVTLALAGDYGISLYSSSDNVLSGNNVSSWYSGIYLYSSSRNVLSGNNVTSSIGINLHSSSSNVLSDNNVENSWYDIFLNSSSDNNTLSGNIIATAGWDGIYLNFSSYNVLCDNNVANSSEGIYLYSSSGNVLSGNTIITNGWDGICLNSSSYNVLSGNNLTANGFDGIYLYSSSDNNTLSGNNVTANSYYGITLAYSSRNVLSDNNVANSHKSYGIWLYSASGNRIIHNNFLNNKLQAYVESSTNTWDDGYPSGGNYWSDYQTTYPDATEIDSSGIWNTPYVIDTNNTDRYPLTGPFHTFGVGTWNETAYSVDTVSNSTITDLTFNQTGKTLSFNVTGISGTLGFCRVAIPKTLMSCASLEDWIVTVNGTLINDRTIINSTSYTYIYFTYHHSTETVQITSTSAIPEFQPYMLLPLLMIITLLKPIVSKKKRKVVHITNSAKHSESL